MKEQVDLGSLFASIKQDVIDLVNNRLEWLKLDVFEKTSVAASALLFGLILVNGIFFTLLFAFLALGFLLSEWMGSYAGGFGLVVVFYLIILTIVFCFRKTILTKIGNLVLNLLYPDLEKDLKKKEDENK